MPDIHDPAVDPLDLFLAEGRLADAEALALTLLPDRRRHRKALAALARCAAARNDLPGALRWADRARRIAPADASLAALLGALLIAAGRPGDAVPHLTDGLAQGAGVETEIALASAQLLTGVLPQAASRAADLLRTHPIRQTALLAGLADRLVRAGAAPGWVAHDGDRLIGALRISAAAAGLLSIEIDGQPYPASFPAGLTPAAFLERFGAPTTVTGPAATELAAFALPLPQSGPSGNGEARITLQLGRAPLIGAPLPLVRPSPAVDGAVRLHGSALTGWARHPAAPQQAVTVVVRDETGTEATVTAWPAGASTAPPSPGLPPEEAGTFRIDLTRSGLGPGRLAVTAGPDRHPLAGSPLRWIDWPAVARAIGLQNRGPGGARQAAADADAAWRRLRSAGLPPIPMPVGEPPPRPPPSAAMTAAATAAAIAIDVVIPVYRGREETMACLTAVLATTTMLGAAMPGSVVVIDDASPDPDLAADLRILAASGRITLLRNPHNLGFPATVNRGLALHGDRDAIVLNADTLVSGDWWRRLRDAAHSAPDVGTATPLSNDATILSYPPGGGPPPASSAVAALDAVASAANPGLRVEIPTGVGFCWYIRRACWDEVGGLSETLFGRGYGEENDFCLRARQMGWRHVAAADVFVAHVGGRSFGPEKARLLARNVALVNELHPGYDALVQRFIAADPLAAARRRIDLARLPPAPAPALLLITFDLGGGVARHVEERGRRLADEGRRFLRLLPHPPGTGGAPRCRIDDPEHPDRQDLVFAPATEQSALCVALRRMGVVAVEFHHLLNHDPQVADLPGWLGVPYDVTVHDHVALCPRITMIDGSGRYCGDPGPDHCTRCIRTHGSRFGHQVPILEHRARYAALLRGARRVVVPSHDTATRLLRHVPAAPVVVTPWDDATPPAPAPRTPRPALSPAGRSWRICVIGAIGAHKGYHVLLDCARDAAARDLPLDFVVIGHSEGDAALFATGRVFLTGPYREGEAPALIQAQEGDLAFLPSVWPETWSYTLSEAWRAGLPVVAFDLGAVAERVRRQGGGWLLPLGSTPATINDTLLAALAGKAMAATPLDPPSRA